MSSRGDLSREVSSILGFTVPEGQYIATFKQLEKEGRLHQKSTNELIALILTRLERLENFLK